jgi:hypothetical protein
VVAPLRPKLARHKPGRGLFSSGSSPPPVGVVMFRRLRGAGRHGTRQAVAGMPGVGNTMLVQEAQATLYEDGYFTTDAAAMLRLQ